MYEKIRVLTSCQISSLADDVDLFAILLELNNYIKTLIPKINIQDLGDWRLLILALYRPTDGIGVFKRSRRYQLDQEFEFSISIPIPDNNQASYGLLKVKEGFFQPLSDKFYILEPNFGKYDNLYDYIFESSKRAIDLAFTKGIVCGGKKITLQD